MYNGSLYFILFYVHMFAAVGRKMITGKLQYPHILCKFELYKYVSYSLTVGRLCEYKMLTK